MKEENKECIFIGYEGDTEADYLEDGQLDNIVCHAPIRFADNTELLGFALSTFIDKDGQLIRSIKGLLSEMYQAFYEEQYTVIDHPNTLDNDYFLLDVMQEYINEQKAMIKSEHKEIEEAGSIEAYLLKQLAEFKIVPNN